MNEFNTIGMVWELGPQMTPSNKNLPACIMVAIVLFSLP